MRMGLLEKGFFCDGRYIVEPWGLLDGGDGFSANDTVGVYRLSQIDDTVNGTFLFMILVLGKQALCEGLAIELFRLSMAWGV